MRRIFEKAVKWLLTASGFVTSIVILLIIGFLFTEGAGLFKEKVIEEGYVLALNRENNVKELTAAQIKAIFDEDVTNWKEFGGPDMRIEPFRLEDADKLFTEEELGGQYENAGNLIASLIEAHPGMVAFVPESMIPKGANLNFIEDRSISPKEVFAGSEWFPTATPAPLFGMWPLLAGTLWVSLFAILFALPFGIGIGEGKRFSETGYRAVERYPICGLRLFRAYCNSAAAAAGIRPSCGRKRPCRQHSVGNHGASNHSHCCGGCNAQLPPFIA